MTFGAASFGERAFSEDVDQNAVVAATGQQLTSSIGTVTVIAGVLVEPTGVSFTAQVGSVTVNS